MGAIRQYVGARYVPKLFDDGEGGNNWVSGVPYEPLTIVTYLGSSYTSKIPVPSSVGNPASNSEYWVCTGNYNAQVEIYREEVQEALNTIDDKIDEAIESIEDDLNDTLDRVEKSVDKMESVSYKNALGPIIIAHRGFGGEAPENTIAAFDLCGSLSADAVETDIQFTSDGIPVCSHDDNIALATGVSANISSMTYAELSQIPVVNGANVSYFGQQVIPTFEQYCLRAYLNRFIPYIEIKSNYTLTEARATLLIDILKKYGIKEKSMFISNNLDALNTLLALDRSLTVMPVLYAEPTDAQLETWAGRGYYGVTCTLTGCTAHAIEKAHSLGMKYHGWTVSTYTNWWGLQTYMNRGIDGFTCDYATYAALPSWETGVRVLGKQNFEGFPSTSSVDSALMGLKAFVRGWLGGYDVRDKYAFGCARFFFTNANRVIFKLPDHTASVTFGAAGAEGYRYSVFAIDDDGQISDSNWITVTSGMTYNISTVRKNVFLTIAGPDNNTAIGYIQAKSELERLNVQSSFV